MRRSAPFCWLLLHAATLGMGVTLLAVAFAPGLSGCASSGLANSPEEAPSGGAPPERTAREASGSVAGDSASAPAARVASALRAETRRWEGTPHQMGGTTRRGVDCSAFMQRVFERTMDVRLPRSTRSQVQEGQRVAREDLRAGDLVFFRPGGKGRHVGVYVGDGEFAHASTSAGPTISPLERGYWQDAYWTARRVVRLASGDSRSAGGSVPVRPAPARGSSDRAGW
ncbi:MAG: glycoside hydrolase [Bacteroidetes bacterium QS_9_68_14]|nr:MAG: glycoside hydrolase [Bacteroidetes bacterium QS_9_68_14]